MEDGCQKWALRFIIGTLLTVTTLIAIVLTIVTVEGCQKEPIVDCGYAGMQKESTCEWWNEKTTWPKTK